MTLLYSTQNHSEVSASALQLIANLIHHQYHTSSTVSSFSITRESIVIEPYHTFLYNYVNISPFRNISYS